MVEIDSSSFCHLSGTHQWQTWLYATSPVLHKEFVVRMRASKGCRENKKIMLETLDILKDNGLEEQLVEFLRKEFPYTVKSQKQEIFPDYNSKLLTVPRRTIVSINECHAFLDTVPYAEFYEDNDLVYIEYLTDGLLKLKDIIPHKNWILRRFKTKIIHEK